MSPRLRTASALVFVQGGGVELHDEQDRVLWKSSQHREFVDNFGSFVSADEAEDILEWMVDENILTSASADDIEIFEDSLTDAENDEDDDDDDDGDRNANWD